MSWGLVIVNYNNARLAIDAGLSALADAPDARIVIVDNASADDSWNFFQKLAAGEADHAPTAPADPPAPVAFAPLARHGISAIEQGGAPAAGRISVVRAPRNGGFAAGCNIGLRLLRDVAEVRNILLLNPDAALARGALAAFDERLKDTDIGLCGASVLRFDPPHPVQALGGARLSSLTLLGRNLYTDRSLDARPATGHVEGELDYPLGAAMALRTDYLSAVGGLDERFFLYYEEADWARRGRPHYRCGWARDAIVYHRHGASAGSRDERGRRSPLADRHMARSRFLYAAKWRSYLIPLLIMLTAGQAVRRLLRGDQRQAAALLSTLSFSK